MSREAVLERLRNEWLAGQEALLGAARTDAAARERLRDLVACTLARERVAWRREERERLAAEAVDELTGLGPLEPLLRDEEVTEIMVNGPGRIYVERGGVLEATAVAFRSEEQLAEILQRIVAPLGRRIDPSAPFVDGRLPDGSRVHAIIPPLALGGPFLTVRKFRRRAMSPEDLVRNGTCSQEMMDFLAGAVRARCNLVVSGGTGSGKTTTLNALSACIDPGERVITIEDAAELRLQQAHVLALEARPANAEGKGEVTIRTLLRNALRMRPDRILIGEVRGGEALDLLQALNTGHEGGMTTVHANSPVDALRRLATMALMAGSGLPHPAVLEQIGATIDLVVQQARLPGGERRLTAIAAVGLRQGRPVLRGLFAHRSAGEGAFVRLPAPFPARLAAKFRAAGVPLPPPATGGEGR